jgi:hypothetical protein
MKIPYQFGLIVLPVLFSLTASVSGQTYIEYSDAERLVQADDNIGNWAISSSSGTVQYLAGDSSNNNNIYEVAFTFDISSWDSEITEADLVTFDIAYDTVYGDGADLTVYIFGSNTSSVDSIGGTTFNDSAVAGSDAGEILSSSFVVSTDSEATWDITTIVQSLLDYDYLCVLVTSDYTENDNDSEADAITFYRDSTLSSQTNGGAYLTIIPEPGTFALLAGLIGFGAVMMRRRG